MYSLFNKYEKEEKEKYLMEQYKLYVELTDRISQRRAVTNTFYLTTNAALITFVAGFKENLGIYLYVVCFVGIIISIFWYFSIRSYKQLNTVKFGLIREIETKLPLNLFNYEWNKLDCGKSFKTYWPLTHVENLIPFVFATLYFMLGLIYKICEG